MPAQYVISYLLLTLLALLALSCLASALALLWQRRQERRRVTGANGPAAYSFRRCEECSARWKATEDDRPDGRTLRRLRTRRRLARTLTGSGPRRLPPSWDRCPHCLSTAVRASRSSRGSRSGG